MNVEIIRKHFPAVDEDHPRMDMIEAVAQTLMEDTSLPASSMTTSRLYDVVNNPDSSIEEIAYIVQTDPGLTAQFFNMAQSAIYGASEVNSLENALMRIGMKEVRRFCSSSMMVRTLESFSGDFDLQDFIKQTLLAARLTEVLCSKVSQASGAEYLAGMVHNIGSLVLISYFDDDYRNVLSLIREGIPTHKAEQRIFGLDHQHVGAALCESWGISDHIITAIKEHHDPFATEGNQQDKLLSVVLYTTTRLIATTFGDSNYAYDPFEGPESSAEWQWLTAYGGGTPIQLNIEREYEIVLSMISAIKIRPTHHMGLSEV